MEFVEPIRDAATVRRIGEYLYHIHPKMRVLYYTGILAGLRISEILQLRVWDVAGDSIRIKDQETGKEKFVAIHPELKKIYQEYTANMKPWDYLIPSARRLNKPITREYAYKVIHKAGQYFGIDNLGTHSLRKTFGYHYYQQTHNAEMLRQILNYSTEEKTLRYIGVEQDVIDDAIRDLRV